MLYRVFVFVCILSLASCVDNKDYNLDSLTLTPTVALPLAFGNVSILDLISNKDSTYLKVYPDGLLYLSYSQTLASQDVRGLFNIPNNNSVISFDLPSGSLPPSGSDVLLNSQNKLIDLNLSPEQLTEILLKAGSVGYTVSVSQATAPPNSLPFEVDVTLTDITDKNTHVPLSFVATTGSGSKPLQNYIMKMNNNKFNIKMDLILKQRNSAVFIAPNTKVNIQLSFTSLDFVYILGFLGDQTANLQPQTVDISVFNSSLNKTKISFVQPVISLSVRNDYGVPLEVTFTTLDAKKTGATLPLQINPASPVALSFPSTFGTSATTGINVTNAAAIINFSPTQLVYSASARINKGLTSGTDFLQDTSKLKVTLTADVPLYGQASGISLTDTLSLDLGSVEQSTVTTASLKVKAVNQMPLDANIQLYLTDKSYHIIDSVFSSSQTYLVKASTVTGTGDLQTAGSVDLKIDLDDSRINKLFSSNYMIIKAKMNTSKDANGTLLNVKFKSTYKLTLNVGLLAKLKISTNK